MLKIHVFSNEMMSHKMFHPRRLDLKTTGHRTFTRPLLCNGVMQAKVCVKSVPVYNVTKTHHRIRFQEYYFDVKQMFEDGFIMLLHHFRQHLHIFEDGQPEVGDSFRFFIFVNPK